MTAPDHAYTDRDVRSDLAKFRSIATKYVQGYTGAFEPLVDAQDAVKEGLELTLPMVRKVLNCMRHDFAVAASLPRVVPMTKKSNVVDIFTSSRSRPRDREIRQCDSKSGHYRHNWWDEEDEDLRYFCEGVEFEINRWNYSRPATVKAEFALAGGGALVHRTTGKGKVFWVPEEHDWGFVNQIMSVKVVCKYPSWLKNPRLYKEEPVDLYDVKSPKPFSRCKHCFGSSATPRTTAPSKENHGNSEGSRPRQEGTTHLQFQSPPPNED